MLAKLHRIVVASDIGREHFKQHGPSTKGRLLNKHISSTMLRREVDKKLALVSGRRRQTQQLFVNNQALIN